ncbi:MAG: thermonuclease family protein [Sphingobacterium sp.]
MMFNLSFLSLRLLITAFIILNNIHGLTALPEHSVFVNEIDKRESSSCLSNELDSSQFVKVFKVIDGDTFWVDDGNSQFKVRFIGIDAPETRNTKFKKKEYYAQEAKDYVTKVSLHKKVKLVWDVQKVDRYQRALAYVYLEDGTFLNANLVENGYAVVSTFPPNIKHVDLFLKLQYDAREKQCGLWSIPVQELTE